MGLLKALVGFFVNREINTGKSKNFFDALKNDKEYQEALKRVKESVVKIEAAGEAAVKQKAKFDSAYDEMVKKYGKEAADKVVSDVHNYTYSWNNTVVEKKNDFVGEKCLYCNSVISSSKSNQFCSVKCEKEYTEFKSK